MGAIKDQRVVARCTLSDKNKFKDKTDRMGWKDTTAFLMSVIDLVNTGKLVIEAPKVPTPTVIFND